MMGGSLVGSEDQAALVAGADGPRCSVTLLVVDTEGLGIQGALYLSDTTVDGGGFRMIPGFAARFNGDAKFREQAMAWRAEAADNAPGGCKDLAELTGMPTVTLPGKAGDLVICASSSSLVRSARQWRQCATTVAACSMWRSLLGLGRMPSAPGFFP